MNEKEMIEEMEKFIIKTRNILKNILLAGTRPVKNTSRKDCYFCLMNLQELYKSNTSISDKDFLKILFGAKRPEGSVVLSKEEYEKLQNKLERYSKEREFVGKCLTDATLRCVELTNDFNDMLDSIYDLARKKTAKEILQEIMSVGTEEEKWLKNEPFVCYVKKMLNKIEELAKQYGVEVEE